MASACSAGVLVKVRLNWSGAEHYDAAEARPCRCCGTATHSRDSAGGACCQNCAEGELARELAGTNTGRVRDERYLGARR
jgi:hypothetical protein